MVNFGWVRFEISNNGENMSNCKGFLSKCFVSFARIVALVYLVAFVFAGSSCSGPPPENICDENCQKDFFYCFRQVKTCEQICSLQEGEKVSCVKLLDSSLDMHSFREERKKLIISFKREDCERCRAAFALWQKGKDCSEGEMRCRWSYNVGGTVGRLLQKCVEVFGRYTWSQGRLCTEGDGHPCVKFGEKYLCLGCKDRADCFRSETCEVGSDGKGRCIQCRSDRDCRRFHRLSLNYCVDGRCVACRSDADCKPLYTGLRCIDGRCACREDADCQKYGFIGCDAKTGKCQRCSAEKNKCSELFPGKRTLCSVGRCLIICNDSSPCDDGFNCLKVTSQVGVCIHACDDSAQCRALGYRFCREGICRMCESDRDCPRGLSCSQNYFCIRKRR